MQKTYAMFNEMRIKCIMKSSFLEIIFALGITYGTNGYRTAVRKTGQIFSLTNLYIIYIKEIGYRIAV